MPFPKGTYLNIIIGDERVDGLVRAKIGYYKDPEDIVATGLFIAAALVINVQTWEIEGQAFALGYEPQSTIEGSVVDKAVVQQAVDDFMHEDAEIAFGQDRTGEAEGYSESEIARSQRIIGDILGIGDDEDGLDSEEPSGCETRSPTE